MKLTGREAARYLDAPDRAAAGVLLYGDPSRVGLRRAGLVEAIIGPDGAAEMRLARIAAADLRRDPPALADAVKAIGFFPGARAVLVEEAGDALAPVIAAALADWRPGDAQILVTAGTLGAASSLRRAFEKAPRAVAIGLYADPPRRDEIEADLARAGIARTTPMRWSIWRPWPAASMPASSRSISGCSRSTNATTRRRSRRPTWRRPRPWRRMPARMRCSTSSPRGARRRSRRRCGGSPARAAPPPA